MTLLIDYRIETTDAGWVVWRQVGDGEPVACGLGARAIVYRSRAEAEQQIATQRRADLAAATRLGVEVRHP